MFKEFLVGDLLDCKVAITKDQADIIYSKIKNEKSFTLNFVGVNVVSRRFIFELLGETRKYKDDIKIIGLEPTREKRVKDLLHDFKVMNLWNI